MAHLRINGTIPPIENYYSLYRNFKNKFFRVNSKGMSKFWNSCLYKFALENPEIFDILNDGEISSIRLQIQPSIKITCKLAKELICLRLEHEKAVKQNLNKLMLFFQKELEDQTDESEFDWESESDSS